jgi:hypothetical protein
MTVSWQVFAEGTEEAMRAIPELELSFRMRAGQAQQDLPGVDTYSREVVSDAVSRVESDRARAGLLEVKLRDYLDVALAASSGDFAEGR